MVTPMHQCPIVGCQAHLPYGTLMCRTHWKRVPAQLRSEVYAAWDNGSPREDYMDVRARAIAAVGGGNTRGA
jgi:hypothetical protein